MGTECTAAVKPLAAGRAATREVTREVTRILPRFVNTPQTPLPPEPVAPPADTEDVSPGRLFVAFSSLALSGFGGVLPFAYRALVEKQRWLTAKDFASLLAVAQVLPGPTICNLSVMIGHRFAGLAGAGAALAGMLIGPMCVVIALGIAWQRFGALPAVDHGLRGMTAVAIGLILATAVKMGITLFKPAPRMEGEARAPYWNLQRVIQVVLCAAAFAGVGLFRWPLVAVVAITAPFAIALSWFTDREPST